MEGKNSYPSKETLQKKGKSGFHSKPGGGQNEDGLCE